MMESVPNFLGNGSCYRGVTRFFSSNSVFHLAHWVAVLHTNRGFHVLYWESGDAGASASECP